MYSLFQILFLVLDLVWWVIVLQIIMSWLFAFNILSTSNTFVLQIHTMLERLTAPLLDPIRKRIPYFNGIDLSPLVLLLLISFIRIILSNNMGYFVG